MNRNGVSVAGQPLEHRLYHFQLAYSGFEHSQSCWAARATWRWPKASRTHAGHLGERLRNTKGVAHENGAIERPHGHLKRAIADALILRGSHDLADLEANRRFIDEIVGRINARNAKRIDVERISLKPLPVRRTTDCEEVTVRVTCPF